MMGPYLLEKPAFRLSFRHLAIGCASHGRSFEKTQLFSFFRTSSTEDRSHWIPAGGFLTFVIILTAASVLMLTIMAFCLIAFLMNHRAKLCAAEGKISASSGRVFPLTSLSSSVLQDIPELLLSSHDWDSEGRSYQRSHSTLFLMCLSLTEPKSVHSLDLPGTQLDEEDTFSCQSPEEECGGKVLGENFSSASLVH